MNSKGISSLEDVLARLESSKTEQVKTASSVEPEENTNTPQNFESFESFLSPPIDNTNNNMYTKDSNVEKLAHDQEEYQMQKVAEAMQMGQIMAREFYKEFKQLMNQNL